MQDFGTYPVAVANGELLLFSDFEDNGPMWSSDGPRLVRRAVRFERPFRWAPTVMVSLQMWDLASGPNLRGDLSADAIAPERFDVVFKTWGDSRIARLRVSWIAIGAVAHADDWQL